MAYASIQDAVDLYGQDYIDTSVGRTDDDPPVPDTDELDKALTKASSEIDSYLATRYSVPLSTVPDIVGQCCIDIGIYRSSVTAGLNTDEKRKRYEDAVKWLLNVAKGVVTIPGSSEDTTEQLPQFSGSPRLFTRTTMDGL